MQLEHDKNDRYTVIVGSGTSSKPYFAAGGTFIFKGNGYPESPEFILGVGGAGYGTYASLTENGMTWNGGANGNGFPASGVGAGSGYKGERFKERVKTR